MCLHKTRSAQTHTDPYFILRTFLSTSYADLNSISYLFILLVWASTIFYTCVGLVQHVKIPETFTFYLYIVVTVAFSKTICGHKEHLTYTVKGE